MRARSALRSVIVGVCLVAVALPLMASAATASTIYLCVEEKAEGAVKSGGTTGGSCKTGYDQVALPSEEKEQKKLLEILPYLKFVEKGIDSKPTVQVSGANVQILSGAGSTNLNNGEGNLIIGYDETPGEQTGSHNLVLGMEQKYTSYGAIIGGLKNSSLTPFTDVFGYHNIANAETSSLTGGSENETKGPFSSISGGKGNFTTSGSTAAGISGGKEDKTEGSFASVSGGHRNLASGAMSSVSGGEENKATGELASVNGGTSNLASGFASIAAGDTNSATSLWSVVLGGGLNKSEGSHTAILGGKEKKLTESYSTSP